MNGSEKPGISLWWTLLKLSGCGIVIAAIGFVITTFDLSGDISESKADVSWLSPFKTSNTEGFDSALDNLGHGDAERYDLNGNTVFFSTNTTRKQPGQVMAEYQEEFRRQGLNDRVYADLDTDEEYERTQTALTGGLIPLAVTDDYVALGGVLTNNEASDSADLMANYDDADDVHELFRAHRYVEISREADSRHTSVIASWSDEDFDHRRMIPGDETSAQGYDSVVPPCPGCTRLSRFADDDPNRAERVEMSFIGPASIERTRTFYARALAEAGWQRESLNQEFYDLEQWFRFDIPDGETDQFRRGDDELTLTYRTDRPTGETITMASRY